MKPDQKLQAIVNLVVPSIVTADAKAEKEFLLSRKKRAHGGIDGANRATAGGGGGYAWAAGAAGGAGAGGGGDGGGGGGGGSGSGNTNNSASSSAAGASAANNNNNNGGGGNAKKKVRDAILQDQISFELMPDLTVAQDMQYAVVVMYSTVVS